ncbi:MAG: hypothetical protein V7641_5024 [Blastocatellia bacterium]
MTDEVVVTANKFILTDSNGKQRASLFLEDDMAMLAFFDAKEKGRLLLAVTPDGAVTISALHEDGDGKMESSFSLLVDGGEPEIVMRDAIFADTTIMSARGFFSSQRNDGEA